MVMELNADTEKRYDIYHDIQMRTKGEIYLGVVGPVRTGKSTFIKRFMDLCVLPQMENEHVKERARDELPQSAAGTTIMTTEPKFVPSEAAIIHPAEGLTMKTRLIDCVGFMVEGALGHIEHDKERMVKTPWSEEAIPFTRAAEIGTRKVIEEHSTIGIVVTTDGSFTDIDRESYVPAEEKTILELLKLSKPFIVLLNSAKPHSQETIELSRQMEEKYKVHVMPVNCDQLQKNDVMKILENVLMEFPVSEIDYYAPEWVSMLSEDHALKKYITSMAFRVMDEISKIKDVKRHIGEETDNYIESIDLNSTDLSTGTVVYQFKMKPDVYYDVLSELTNEPVHNEYQLINMIRELSQKKQEFMKMANALSDVNVSGFGIVTPARDEITLETPEVIKNGNKFGVKIKAQVPAINLLKTNINIEIAPIVGTKNQADDLIAYIEQHTKDNAEGIWDTNIFGKTVEQIVEDGIREKTHNITGESVDKICTTLEKVMNENSGLVCLIV
ncbi:MAG: stage IV sporulation protein A [Eubacteriales bacterium]|nr:stage IV sporulation protein A [Eubacteriales bacterium]